MSTSHSESPTLTKPTRRIRVSVGATTSSVLIAGPQDGDEAVVFIHGNPGPATDWNDLLDRVGHFARAIAPDMPGYGEADKPADFTYTIDGYAAHLGGLLNELGVRRVHLVAHDLGGPWALAWAADHPNALASATLINTGVVDQSYRWHRYAKIWRMPGVGEVFQMTAPRPVFRWLVGRENPALPRPAIDGIYRASRGWGTTRAILRFYRATPESAMRGPGSALRALDRPALVLWGREDRYLPYRLADHQRSAFPSADVEILDRLGHWPMHEDPEAVAERVVPFLRRQVAAR